MMLSSLPASWRLEGTPPLGSAFIVNKGGEGSFDQVMCGWRYLQKPRVDCSILCTVHAANGGHPLEVCRFFRDELKAEFMQWYAAQDGRQYTGVGRNQRCPCGSGKKFKHCHARLPAHP
jgi:sulfatase maturation enzyme AslB (radical SAM superfamily)